MPRATYMPYPFQIMQSPQHVMIVHEFAGAVRTIYMDKKDQIEAPADSWMGWSHGRWEGDTLVVDTKGFLDPPGSTARATTTATRCTRSSASRRGAPTRCCTKSRSKIPKVFTRPWKMSMPLYRRVERNAQLVEYLCVEFAEDAI